MDRDYKNNISGNRYGNLLVIRRLEDKNLVAMWHCLCDCGNEKAIAGPSLKRNRTKSCGCLGYRIDNDKRSEYKTWASMIRRCTSSKDKSYPRYGGRGISVCSEWLDFDKFYRDMGARPKGLQIDRKDNDGNYEASNCRWITLTGNIRNGSTAKLNPTKVRVIRNLLKIHTPLVKISKMFNVLPCTISKIKLGQTWSDIS